MKIVIITYNRFPEGDAGAVREYALGRLLKSMGHEVVVIGMGKHNEGVGNYNSINYYSLRNNCKGLIGKLKNYFGFEKNLIKKLKEVESKDSKINAFIVSGVPLRIFFLIELISRLKKIILIHNSVEWYSHQQFKLGYLSVDFLSKNILNSFVINKYYRVIAISTYLKKYFDSKNITAKRIPVILPIDEISHEKNVDFKKLNIIYAGSPGKKDYLKEMLEGIYLLDDLELVRIEFNLFGINEIDIKKILKLEVYSKIKKSLKIHGRVGREEVLKNFEKAHFSVLLRNPDLRYSKAGFPTKVAESLATGTPVISNLSSDLEFYLQDGRNSIILEDYSQESFKKGIQKALKIEQVKFKKMFDYSRKTAEISFNFICYKNEMSELLKNNGV